MHRVSEQGSSRQPGFQCISVPGISVREDLPSPQRKAAGWYLEARVVDRDLTVTQVNNCKHLERKVGLGKQFLNSQMQL